MTSDYASGNSMRSRANGGAVARASENRGASTRAVNGANSRTEPDKLVTDQKLSRGGPCNGGLRRNAIQRTAFFSGSFGRPQTVEVRARYHRLVLGASRLSQSV